MSKLFDGVEADNTAGQDVPEELTPVNWLYLTVEEARGAWLDLNAWVTTWLRVRFALPPTELPPLWHRHPPMVEELSALHTHWLACYDPDASPSAPAAWMRDFHEFRARMREWVAACGTKLDRDRPDRITAWPGEQGDDPDTVPTVRHIVDREADFAEFLDGDLASRRIRLADVP